MASQSPREKGTRGSAPRASAKAKKTGSKKKASAKRKPASKKAGSRKAGTKKAGPAKARAKAAAVKKTAVETAVETAVNTADVAAEPVGERLHKFLASTGAGSRRECETFIAQGRVTVNGEAITKLGTKVDPVSDVVTLDGERVRPEERVYYLLHKPSGYICTNSDERGRPRAMDLVRDERRVYTVGRLDADSTGLVLLTNDGGIANIICHPRYRIEKRYHVHVRGDVTRAQIARVETGVWLAEGKSSPALVRPLGRNPKRGETILEMTLFEGRNREIRRVFARVGLTVRRLQRTAIGPLELKDLAPGAYRRLGIDELTFVGEAEQMYLANRVAWDAELPAQEERRRPRQRPRQQPQKKPRAAGAARESRGPTREKSGWGDQPFPKRSRRRTGEQPESPRPREDSPADPAGRRRRRYHP